MSATTERSLGDAVMSAWRDALAVDALSVDSNFFSLGGDSFTAMRVLARIQDETGIAVTFADLLAAPVLGEFVERLPRLDRTSTGTRAPHRGEGPMTAMQLECWRRRKRGSGGAEVYWLYEVNGRLDVAALRRAVDELVERHEILRTTFRRRRWRPRQVVEPFVPGVLREVKGPQGPRQQRLTAAVQQLIDEDYLRPFDYERGPLIRATLVTLDTGWFLFSVAASELVVDGSSRQVLANALSTLYALVHDTGTAEDYPRPPLQFCEFAEQRKAFTSGSRYNDQVLHWRTTARIIEPSVAVRGRRLSPGPDPAALPPVRSASLPRASVAAVQRTARELGTTAFNVLAAAFVVLLRGLAETDRPAFTTTISYRDLPGADELIGTFYNILLVSVPLEGLATAADAITATAASTKDAFSNRDVPLPRVLRFRRGAKAAPDELDTLSIRFQLHEDPGEIHLSGVRTRRLEPLRPMHQLYLAATEVGGGLDLLFSCRPDMPPSVVKGFLDVYRRVLDTMTQNRDADLEGLVRTASSSLLR